MGLPWIELHTSLPRHPKSVRLALLIDNDLAWAFVAQLWLWCAENCQSGRIVGGDLAVRIVERACGWRGESGHLVQALLSVGFLDVIDGGFEAHGWPERAQAHIAKLERDAERAKERRAKVAKRFAAECKDVDPDATSPGRRVDVAPTSVRQRADVAGNKKTNTNTNPETNSSSGGPGFFAKVQTARVAHGYASERAPHPSALGAFFSEALMELNGDEARLWGAYEHFAESDHWAKATPPWPFTAFMKLWRDFVPRKSA